MTNMFMLVLCPVRTGLYKCLVIYFGNMGSKEECEKEQEKSLSMPLSVFVSKSNTFMLLDMESLLGKRRRKGFVPESMHFGLSLERNTRDW